MKKDSINEIYGFRAKITSLEDQINVVNKASLESTGSNIIHKQLQELIKINKGLEEQNKQLLQVKKQNEYLERSPMLFVMEDSSIPKVRTFQNSKEIGTGSGIDRNSQVLSEVRNRSNTRNNRDKKLGRKIYGCNLI